MNRSFVILALVLAIGAASASSTGMESVMVEDPGMVS